MDKLELWKKIQEELLSAQKLLPKNVVESDFGYRESDFRMFIDANELGLAIDELDGVMEDNPNPGREFWTHMIIAAKLMDLEKETAYEKYKPAS